MRKRTAVANKNFELKNLKRIGNFFRRSVILLLFVHVLFFSANAQDDKPKDLVPPPLSIISKEEKSQLDEEKNIKKRTQLALELMDVRLAKAAELSEKNRYKESLDELGAFQAILRNAFNFLKKSENGSRKVLNNFKRFEINLRQFMPKLEVIRREMPVKYGYHVRNLMKYVREARADAVEPFFGETVLREDG